MKTRGSIHLMALLCVLLLEMGTRSVDAAIVDFTTPPGATTKEGDSKYDYDDTYLRFQQVISSTAFMDIMPQGGWITMFYIRGDGPSAQPGNAGLTGAQISFSTTSKGVNSLSPVFADNLGPDNSVFLSPSQSFNASIRPRGVDGVRGWGPYFDAQPPSTPSGTQGFFYDPRKGNLLMDFQNFRPTLDNGAWTLDADTSPLMSSVFIPPPSQDTTQGVLSSKGLVMLFTVVTVPEPGPLALLAMAGLLVWGIAVTGKQACLASNGVRISQGSGGLDDSIHHDNSGSRRLTTASSSRQTLAAVRGSLAENPMGELPPGTALIPNQGKAAEN